MLEGGDWRPPGNNIMFRLDPVPCCCDPGGNMEDSWEICWPTRGERF